ncbi:MAG: hypothetical protein FWG73_00630 [Planctomycetaceae bacterium]|nr:hypothetical protein [Planctomycetaceae bacterium]
MQKFHSILFAVGSAMLVATASLLAEIPTHTILLQGTVVDDAGKPVADAEVYYGGHTLAEIVNPERRQRTDEHGKFVLPIPAERFHRGMPLYAFSPEKERLAEARPKLKEGISEITEFTLTLEKTRIITGTVTDGTGTPVAGAMVGGTWDTPYPSVTYTDKDGHFRFAYPEDGIRTLHQVFAVHTELGMDYVETEEGRGLRSETSPGSISDGPFSLTLIPWQTYPVRVVDEHQTPIPGIEVNAWLQRKPGVDSINIWIPILSVTDAQGIATVPSISERTYFVARPPAEGVLMPDGSRLFFGNTDKFSTDFDPSEAIPTLVLERRANVKGTVKRADGTPVAWSGITISRHNLCGHGIQWSNANGEFSIPWAKAGELYDIGVESELGAAPGVFAFDVGDGIEERRLDFVLGNGIRLHGTVYNPDGTPSEQYLIFLFEKCPPGGCPDGVVVRQVSDGDKPNSGGKYEYSLPAVGRIYDISVSSYVNPDVSLQIADFAVNGDEGEIKLDLHLQPGER